MLLEQFRQNGLRITPQRRVILELLANDDSHPTAEQVYQRVMSVMPDVSRTTVYNTFRELSDLGELTPVHDLSQGGQRYDTNAEDHHHLYCVRCHTLIDIDRDFEGLSLAPEETSGYRVLGRQVTFYGICPDCQAAEQSSALGGSDPRISGG
jgi:Fe2+ or Zn2+ uptake regulation protein